MTSSLRFWGANLAWVAVLLLTAHVFGQRCLRALAFRSLPERIAFSTGLGLGVYATGIFFLGLFRILTRETAVLLLAAMALWGGLGSWLAVIRSRQRLPDAGVLLWRLAVAAILVLIALPMIRLAAYPPTLFDALSYHLATAKAYVYWNGLVPVPNVRFPVFAQLAEMLFTASLLVCSDVSAQMVECAMMLLTALALFAAGLRFFDARIGIWAAALWLGIPLVVYVGTSAYVDVGMAAFVLLGVYAFLVWKREDDRRWLVLSGLLLGFGMASKYTAIFFTVAVGGFLLVDAVRRRRLSPALGFAGAAAAPFLPWLVRNAYYTRDPLFPFFGRLFGYSYWSAEDLAFIQHEIRGHGMGRSVARFLELPWNLAFHQDAFVAEASVPKVFLLALPLLLWFAFRRGVARDLLIIAFGYVLFWFWQAQIVRYLLPVIPVLCLLGAALIGGVFRAIVARLPRWLTISLIVGIALLAVAPGYVFARLTVRYRGKPPVDESHRREFLSRFGGYRAYEFLNSRWQDRYEVLAFDGCYMHYFADGVRIGDVVGDSRYSSLYPLFTSGPKLFRAVRVRGADFLLLVKGWSAELPKDEYTRTHFELVYSDSTSKLYRLVTRAAELDAAQAHAPGNAHR